MAAERRPRAARISAGCCAGGLQVKKCRGAILECIRLCEEAGGDRAIPRELFDEDGELDEHHIFCARCTDYETNDEARLPLFLGPSRG